MRVALGSISESVDYGLTASACHEPVGPKFLRITDLQNGSVEWNSVPWCKANEKKRQSAKLNIGDIVFARTGATTGKSFLIRECPEEAVFASYLIRVRLSNKADPRYIAHFFQTSDYWNQITQNARGAAQPGVNATKLKSLKIPLPSLVEQNRIADILDEADALRTKRRGALAQLDTLLKSTFIEMFGDPVTNPMGWETYLLENFCKTGTGGTPSRKKASRYYENGTIPWVKSGNLRENIITSTDEHITEHALKETGVNLVPKNSILLALYGATVGRLGVLGIEATTNQAVCHIIPDPKKAEKLYIFHTLANQVPYLVGRGVGGAQPNISQGIVRSLKIPLPPLDLQNRFAAIVETVEEQKARMRSHLAELDALFASLQHRAFNGEL